VWIKDKPKGTVKYKYYINNTLKEESSNKEYIFSNLRRGTEYSVKIEAIDSNNNVIQSKTKTIKTRYFEKLVANKESETFSVTLYGLEPEITNVAVTEFSASDRTNITYLGAKIKSDRSVSAKLNAKSITPTLETGYYYLQFHLKNSSDQTIDLVNCNIIFGTKYEKNNLEIDPYNIIQNGNYEIIVTDFAGNETKKNFVLKK